MKTLPPDLHARAEKWTQRWKDPTLLSWVTITFSPRFQTAPGSCDPYAGQIRLASFLLDQDPELLAEALCHYLATIAVYRLQGQVGAPHGPLWKRLVARAGFFPRTEEQLKEAVREVRAGPG